MKKKVLIVFVLVFVSGLLTAQVDQRLREDIRNTGFVHKPLPLDYSKSFETFGLTKTVLKSDVLCDMEDMSKWSHNGIGTIYQTNERSKDGSHSLRLSAPTTVDEFLGWGLGFGTCLASYDVGGENWGKYNRLHFYIYPDCEGARSIYLNLYVENDGEIKVPDQYGREGYHEINLINGQWNECFVEMTELARDKVTKLSFAIEVFGKERTMGDSLKFDVDNVKLELIENPEVVSGWQPADNRIIFSTTGYGKESEKTAIVKVGNHNGKFQIVDYNTNQTAFEGDVKTEKTHIGSFETVSFTDFQKEGRYYIRVGDVSTMPFYIDRDIWEDSAWRVLNFMFVERCGYPVPGKHGACHTDLYLRLKEEALWGIDYILKTRFGDGYRAQTWGTNLWTDGFIGTMDDEGRRRIRVHNRGFENFVFSGIEAHASMSIESDEMLRDHLKKVAEEDFKFAMERFERLGYEELFDIKGGGDHAAMASRSQYMANVSYAASLIYKLTGKQYYADVASDFIKYTIQCQRTEPLKDKDKIRGFFYRDLDKKSIVHYTHQSRDNVYMQALTALCETQSDHPEYETWANSIALYGEYLKKIMQYVHPYGMVPSGVYHKDEIDDTFNFYQIQVGVRGGVEEDFKEQLENGVKLDDEHYLRVFPVWFSFKGNAAVHLATGKNAALCGKFLNDKELLDIAEHQLFWIVGKNPFGQSLIWGEGSNYPQQYTALPGETVGEIPVGMQSRFNEDTPYWPQFNTATYKEVWGSSAGKWFSLISEF